MNDFARPYDIKDGRVTYGTDDGLLGEFYIKPELMEAESKTAGYPVYEDRVYCKLISPGNTKTLWDTKANGVGYEYNKDGELTGYYVESDVAPEACDPLRFPKAWDRFIKKGAKVKEGWDVSEWGAIPRSFAESLKGMNIPTVEALAALLDANCDAIMGGRKWRDLARAALDEAKLLSLASEEQERANKAEEQVKQLLARIEGLEKQVASDRKTKAA